MYLVWVATMSISLSRYPTYETFNFCPGAAFSVKVPSAEVVPPPLEFAGSVLYHHRSADQGSPRLIGNDTADRDRLGRQCNTPAANDRGEQQLGKDSEIFSHDVVCISLRFLCAHFL